MTYYVGNENNQSDLLGSETPRFFYALRRTAEGTLYFTRVDQLTGYDDEILVNVLGDAAGNFEDFEYGIDFFEGRSEVDHSRPYENLNYDQYRWDNKNTYYYINAQGQLVARTNKTYNYS